MTSLKKIFERIGKLTQEEGQCEFLSVHIQNMHGAEGQTNIEETPSSFQLLRTFLQKIIGALDDLSAEIKNDDSILISVKNQKLLRTCFQLITSLGMSPSLLPGVGISLEKRCTTSVKLPLLTFTDEEKYLMLVECTDLFTRSYSIPVLKNIILTLHLSDYLAALIQLSFAPFKKPGIYTNFIMTKEMYDKLTTDRHKYVQIYDYLVTNCFQPILMKELFILQSINDPPPPAFVKRVIAKELSQRLVTPGGLISLIRCFIESYNIDTGLEWKKIDTICKIVSAKHGNYTEEDYLNNICTQLKQILSLNNTHYLATAVACVLSLNEKYPEAKSVNDLVNDIFQAFNYDSLLKKCSLPGTILLSPQEVEHKVNMLHACTQTTKLDWPSTLLEPILYTLFLLGVKCRKSEEMKSKLKDITVKFMEMLNKNETLNIVKIFLFGKENSTCSILVEEYAAGLGIKMVAGATNVANDEALVYFIHLFQAATDNEFIQNVFEAALQILVELNLKRQKKMNNDTLLVLEDEPVIVADIDEQYATILQLLSEISTSPKVITTLKTNPTIVLNFIEHFIVKNVAKSNEDCVTIALVLLNTILSSSSRSNDLEKKFHNLTPVLRKMADDTSSFHHILCSEALSLITCDLPQPLETACGRAISDVFDNLLPVRAHGIIELTKLVDDKDPETISKKHYIFCLFQEQLKDSDSYIYLSAVNGLASLCTQCTDDVLHVLCKEFLQVACKQDVETNEGLNKVAELRMKIGDVIVKVTKKLGEMAVMHKTILLNTMLCGCRDDDPLIRTSALSNLAEIALVIHYRIGSIIYEVLLCIWGIIETDRAIECRRAAVMVIASLIKGLGKDTLIELKDHLLPIYRTLKNLYGDDTEDSVVRLHAQLALEELNDVVKQFVFPELNMEKQIFVLDKSEAMFK